MEEPNVIRVVCIREGRREDPLECRVLHCVVGGGPYEALSYEWGQASDEDPHININNSLVSVRSNLYDALLEIRFEDRLRYVWIDALCINQQDTSEKNQQVQMMRQIYQGAEHVIVWLGQADDQSELAMDALETVADLIETSGEFEVSPAHWDGLAALLNRSYWNRVWIQQEVISAAPYFHIHCGRRSVPSGYLTYVIQKIRFVPGWNALCLSAAPGRVLAQTILEALEFGRPVEKTFTLERWLEITSESKATDPRDFVYALLGISCDCQNGEIVPDYNLSVEEVYLQAEQHIFSGAAGSGSGWGIGLHSLSSKMGLNYDVRLPTDVGPRRLLPEAARIDSGTTHFEDTGIAELSSVTCGPFHTWREREWSDILARTHAEKTSDNLPRDEQSNLIVPRTTQHAGVQHSSETP